jgi:L-fuconolactonase
MQTIDAHQHFWKYNPVRDSWINEEMQVIRRDFLPADLEPILEQNALQGCVTVQSDSSEAENAFQLNNARQYDFIKGVVGWVDLCTENVEDRLAYYQPFEKMKGFRHVLQGEPQRDFMLRPDFRRGIGLLEKFNFTYDILIFPDQLSYTQQLVAAYPNQKFVLNHLAKPNIKGGEIKQWTKAITDLARHENIFCKISGMVTEADWQNWQPQTFFPYLDAVVAAFGTDRLMYGSDWPVCLVAGSYGQVLNIARNYFSSFSPAEQENIFGGTATRFYNL